MIAQLLARLAEFFDRPIATVALDFADIGIVAFVIYTCWC